jgi:hypothetical protein
MKSSLPTPMNVYFTASVVGKDTYLTNYLKIIDTLKSKGFIVQADHILNVTEADIHMKTREERLRFHKQLESWIQKSDCMVVEASFPSISVGYEISLALQYRKPVLLLYSIGEPPSLFAYHSDEKLIAEKYTMDTVEAIVNDFINYVHGATDTRFTFFITPQIATYLEKISKQEKMPKSVYLRQLIESHIRENPIR